MNFKFISKNKQVCSILRKLHVEAKILELGLVLPPPSIPKANFVNFVRRGNVLYLSGHLPQPVTGPMIVGKVGKDLTVEQGYEAAKLCGLNLISTLKNNVDNLDKISVTKLFGLVNCVDYYDKQPAVINGCSDLFVKVFGERGKHARSAVGQNMKFITIITYYIFYFSIIILKKYVITYHI